MEQSGGVLRAFVPEPAVVRLEGDFDFGDLDTFLAALSQASPAPAELVIDAAGLGFLSSTGVRGFVLAQHGRTRTTLQGVSQRVRRVLEIGGSASLFSFDDQAAGRAATS